MNLNCPEYLQQAEKHLLKEEERANYYLQPETKTPLLSTIQTEIIEKHAANLVEMQSGCEYMFQHTKLEDLALMFRLFRRVETCLKYIIAKMQPYIEERGEKLVMDEALLKDAVEFTAKLLLFKAEMDTLVEKSFQNEIKFQKARDVSFQNFMNKQDKSPTYIAAFCNNEFVKGLKGVNDQAEINTRLDAIIRLFCCLHSRDIFITAYTNYLAIRLLNKTSLSKDAEELMLQKLKVECGHNTVNKLAQMFNDINISRDLMNEFRGTTIYKNML
jgi:Cullin family